MRCKSQRSIAYYYFGICSGQCLNLWSLRPCYLVLYRDHRVFKDEIHFHYFVAVYFTFSPLLQFSCHLRVTCCQRQVFQQTLVKNSVPTVCKVCVCVCVCGGGGGDFYSRDAWFEPQLLCLILYSRRIATNLIKDVITGCQHVKIIPKGGYLGNKRIGRCYMST